MAEIPNIDELADKLHELAGTGELADRMGRLLVLSDDFATFNGASMAIALWQADPEISKDNAQDLLKSFGELCAEYLDENWDALKETHRKLKAGELRRVPLETLRQTVLDAIATDACVAVETLTEDTCLDALEWSDMIALSIESEFGISGLGHDWDEETTIGQIIAEVDAMVEGYV